MRPDFLITPYEVIACQELRPTDSNVYAVIYWLEHLKDGKCTAGNPFIAEILNVEERTVRAALDRLEKNGFIQRFFADAERKTRTEIKTLVRYTRGEPEQNTARQAAAIIARGETPGEFAKRFFTGDENAMAQALEGFPQSEALMKEVRKFILYWTEPNKSGTKQKWQMQQTFDVRRRLYTWLGRAGQVTGASRAGAGVTV